MGTVKNLPLTSSGIPIYASVAAFPTDATIGQQAVASNAIPNIYEWSGLAWVTATSSGTVTSVSVVSANGLAGTVATATSTPAITLSTTVTGILSGNGTAISAASTTGTGSVVLASGPTLVAPLLGTPASGTLTNCTGLPISTGVSGLGANVASFLATPSSANLAAAVTDETGTGALVFANTPTLVTPILGTPTSGTLTSCTGLPISTGVSGLGSGIATFLGTPSSANLASAVTDETGSGALVFATSPVLVTPALGIPTSGTLTSCTGLPISTGVSGLGSGIATFLGTPSSANLAAAVTDESGTGALVFANTPTLISPILGTPTSGTLTNCTGLPISTGVSGLGTNVAAFLATPSSANLAAAITDETGSGSLVFATSPVLVTPALGTPSSGTLTSCTGLPISTGVSGLGSGVATFLGTPSSANLAAAVTDETGTGALVFATSPVFTTPNIGSATGTASGNTTYSANNHGVVVSSATNAMTVVAPVASTTKVLVSGGASADPTWQDIATGALAVGSFGSTPNSAGASLSGATLTLQPASLTAPGGVSTTTQTFAGTKTIQTTNTTGASLFVITTGAQGTGNGAAVTMYNDSGAAMTSGNRMGAVAMGGARDGASTLVSGFFMAAFATETWSASVRGTKVTFNSVTTGGSSFVQVMQMLDGALTLGVPATNSGLLNIAGSTSGTISLIPQAAAGTYNWNWPTTAGSSGDFLLSGGGSSSPMTWLTPASGIATFLTTPSSANLAAAVTDETGTGALVFANTPTLVTPAIGAATGTSLVLSGALTATSASITASSSGGTVSSTVSNTSNTSSSDAADLIQVAGSSANDPYTQWSINGTSFFSLGIDNSDSDKLKLTQSATSATPSAGTSYFELIISGSFRSGFTGSGVDIFQNNSLRIGANSGGSPSRTNNNQKNGQIVVPHYATATADVMLISCINSTSANTIQIGGGGVSGGPYTASTVVNIYSAANSSTSVGSIVAAFDLTNICTLGVAGTTSGKLNIAGATSGTITIQPQAAAGTYNFNLPITAGSSGDVLTSGGGSSTAMTWSTPASSATASALMIRDSSANVRINNIINGYTTTVTAAGTTTLTVASTRNQTFTGSTTQTCVLPDATTLVVGHQFSITNKSSGSVTVNANGGGLVQVVGAGANALVTVTSIGTSAGVWEVNYALASSVSFVAPTVQTFTSGSGTYTLPSSPRSPLYIKVIMVGGGGGGSGSGDGSGGSSGGSGGNTTFGTTLLVANGGSGGTIFGAAGAGGTGSLGSGPIGTALSGASGKGAGICASGQFPFAGSGGDSFFGGAGRGGGCIIGAPSTGEVGGDAAANTGSGGGGANLSQAALTIEMGGSGGGAGGYVEAIIGSPSATYSYAVGAAGSAGTAGNNRGQAGGAGAAGYIEVTEYYE